MEKTSILLSLIVLFALLGSPSYMVLGQAECQTEKDCPIMCGTEHMKCIDGACVCPSQIRKIAAVYKHVHPKSILNV